MSRLYDISYETSLCTFGEYTFVLSKVRSPNIRWMLILSAQTLLAQRFPQPCGVHDIVCSVAHIKPA